MNRRHNIKQFSNKDLIELCKPYKHSKDIPRWLYSAIRKRNIQDIAMSHIISLNPKRTLEEVTKEAENMSLELTFKRNQIGFTYGLANMESLMKFASI